MPLSDRFREISSQVRNWGRWGPDDQLGTLNLITPEVVLAARDCIRHGRTIPLAVGLEHDGIQVGIVHQLLPVFITSRNIEFPGRASC